MDSAARSSHPGRIPVEEVNLLVLRYLKTTQFSETAKTMLQEVERLGGLPERYDWEGNKHPRTYKELEDLWNAMPKDQLMLLLEMANQHLASMIPAGLRGVNMLGQGSRSLNRQSVQWQPAVHAMLRHTAPAVPPNKLATQNICHILSGREMAGVANRRLILTKDRYSNINLHDRKVGHLCAAYCVTFDRTGAYIITGSDDNLLKIWSAIDARLLATLRGHTSEIADLAVSYENHLVASGGTSDKSICIWSLQTKAFKVQLLGHSSSITSLQFCPQANGSARILVSTGADACVCFWKWDVVTEVFDPKPIKFGEKSRAGAQMLCSSFSPGGVYLATGSSDHTIRVYYLPEAGPCKICELEAHTERVDSIAYSNTLDHFLSGSKDGTARVWRNEDGEWKAIPLNMATRPQGPSGALAIETEEGKKKVLMVTMVSWNNDDSRVITAVSDFSLKVWNPHNGELLHVLTGHTDEMFVLEASPEDPRIVVSAGHDGLVILWDIFQGKEIKRFCNTIQGQGHGAVFDLKFSPDGQSIAATDSHGQVLYFGFGSNEQYTKIPKELFFHTDYRPIYWGPNREPIDEQTDHLPHLLPPPFLVDMEGKPYPPAVQRLVPGRKHCKDQQLIPHVAVNDAGHSQIVTFPEAEDRAEAARFNDRRSIDDEIDRLLREHDYPHVDGANNQANGQAPRANQGQVGIWNNGEGVRQSLGNMAQRILPKNLNFGQKVVVKPLNQYELEKSEKTRQAYAEMELQKKMKDIQAKQNQIRKAAAAKKTATRSAPQQNEETGVNRLVSRALYDTEEEEAESSATELWNGSNADESSEYSDWMPDQGSNLQPPQRRSTRQPKRRRVSVASSCAEDEDDETETEVDDDDTSDEDVEFKESKPRKRPPPKKKEAAKKRPEKRRRAVPEVREVPEEFRPPEWLTDVIPRKTPYVPQMGDEVMYFQQGHELYLNAVHRKKVYTINPNANQPWHKIPHLREQELMKIVGIRYEVKPPHLCCLKLAFIDHDSGRLTGGSFSIKYHDMPDVIDFLVLRQNYDTAMQHRWKPGDRFRSMIDDQWWMGAIQSQQPFNAEYPDSMFQCFKVKWDNNEFESLSPWDMEPIDQNRLPVEEGGGVEVTSEELKSMMYTPKSSEWPACGRDEECTRLVHGIEAIMEHSAAEPFAAPVDLNAFPTYAIVIEYPIDLSTIKGRLENHFYRRVNAVQYDVRYIETNAQKFNEPGSNIVQKARAVSETILRFISDPTMEDPLPLLNSLTRGLNRSASSDSPPSTNSNSRKRRHDGGSQQPNKRRREDTAAPYSWHQDCTRLLNRLCERQDAEPFLRPVSAEEYPDYFNVVANPMDLSRVKDRLEAEHYKSPQDFARDIRLIFSNSRLYNTNKRSRIYTMTLRLSAMFEENMLAVLASWKNRTRSRTTPARLRGAGSSRPSLPSSSNTSQSSSASAINRHLLRLPNGQFAPKNYSPQPSSSRTVAAAGKAALTNGHSSSYRTRAATGSLKPKHYGSSDEEDGEPSQRQRAQVRRNRRQIKTSESSSAEESEEEEEDGEDEEDGDSDETVVQDRFSSEDEDADGDYRLSARPRPCRTATLPPVGTSSRRVARPKKSASKTSVKRKASLPKSGGQSSKARIQTRNQGRRTVHYHEDSDNDARHGIDDDEANGHSSMSVDDDDTTDSGNQASSRGSVSMTMSSRGRIRKLTPRARANLMGAS